MYPQESTIQSNPLTTQEQYIITANQHKTPQQILEVLHDAGYFHRSLLHIERELEWSKPIPVRTQKQEVKVPVKQETTGTKSSDYSNTPLDLYTQMLFAGMF